MQEGTVSMFDLTSPEEPQDNQPETLARTAMHTPTLQFRAHEGECVFEGTLTLTDAMRPRRRRLSQLPSFEPSCTLSFWL